jgi:hypothetical protein
MFNPVDYLDLNGMKNSSVDGKKYSTPLLW